MINTDSKLIFADLTFKIRKAIFTVYNYLGYGHKEEVYQKALAKELTELGIVFKQEASLKVSYKGDVVGYYRPDFLLFSWVACKFWSVETLY